MGIDVVDKINVYNEGISEDRKVILTDNGHIDTVRIIGNVNDNIEHTNIDIEGIG